jgi:hypothetical protein
LIGQFGNPCAIYVTETVPYRRDRRAQSLYCAAEPADGAMRFRLLRPTSSPTKVRWLLDRPVKPGDDGNN